MNIKQVTDFAVNGSSAQLVRAIEFYLRIESLLKWILNCSLIAWVFWNDTIRVWQQKMGQL